MACPENRYHTHQRGDEHARRLWERANVETEDEPPDHRVCAEKRGEVLHTPARGISRTLPACMSHRHPQPEDARRQAFSDGGFERRSRETLGDEEETREDATDRQRPSPSIG